ncbi:MAG TPA: amino acid ABC transporter permease [Candidatus Methanoperedens sp.]
MEIFSRHFNDFGKATLLTLGLTITSLSISCVIGLVFAFFRISNIKILHYITHAYITVIRGTPLIVQIFIFYYGIVNIIVLSPFWAAAIALSIHNGAYITEIFRGSIQSIEPGQMEAARSLGMPYFLAMRRIILPQAFRRAIPSLGNQFIIGLKDSSLAAYVTLMELWGNALDIAYSSFNVLETFVVVGLYYLFLVLIFSYLINKIEKKVNKI